MKTKTKEQEEPKLFEAGEPVVEPAPSKRKGKEVATIERIQPTTSPNMLAIIASAAANPAVDVGKMKELLGMQKEIMAEEARIAFTEAFVAMTLPAINRDGKIEIEGRGGKRGGAMRYATFENINKAVEPVLKQHGFAMWFEPDIGVDGKVIMRGHLDHVKGHGKTCAIALPLENSGAKNNVQGIGSSISYGKRYAAIALLNIVSHAPEDHDTDGNMSSGEFVSEEQLNQLVTECNSVNAPQKKLVEYLNTKRPKGHPEFNELSQLPASRFQEALDTIKTYRPKQ